MDTTGTGSRDRSHTNGSSVYSVVRRCQAKSRIDGMNFSFKYGRGIKRFVSVLLRKRLRQ